MAKKYTVAIDAGHGAKHWLENKKGEKYSHSDPGSIGKDGYSEHKFATGVESYIKKFAAPFKGYVDFVYTSDRVDSKGTYSSHRSSLVDRKDYAHAKGAKEFISIHFDSRHTQRQGTRLHTYDENDKKLAKDIHKDLMSANKAVIDDRYGGGNLRVLLHKSYMPSVLIEFGDKTEPVLRNPQYQETVARALVLSSVERAVANGVKVPENLISQLRADYRTAQHLEIDSGSTKVASKAKDKADGKQEKEVAIKVSPRKSHPGVLTSTEKEIAAEMTFPDLEITKIDSKGNIYSKEHGGKAIASFVNGKIWIGRDFREALSDGAESLPNPVLAIKENLKSHITITKIDSKGNVYAEGYGGGAVMTLLDSGRIFVKAEYRDKLSDGKTAVDAGEIKVASNDSQKVGDNSKTEELENIAQNLRNNGAQYLADNSSQTQIPDIRGDIAPNSQQTQI